MKSQKKAYTKPQLIVHGNVEEITLNGERWEREGDGPHSGFRGRGDD